MGVLRSATHRRVEFRLPVWLRGVFIIAVHHAFVLGLGARHGGIVKLSVVRCVTVFACFTYSLTASHVHVGEGWHCGTREVARRTTI